MRTVLICHDGVPLDQEGLRRWLTSFSDFVGMLVLREPWQRSRHRIRRELTRVGTVRFLDVIAFRLHYNLFLARQDRLWEAEYLGALRMRYRDMRDVAVLVSPSPNSPEAERFIRGLLPDLMLARCKTLLEERIFSIPVKGTYVMHPGICPQYRNAHGCFWALAQDDLQRVGMTLLRIDKGVDTGPVYGYYSYPYDEVNESHIRIQNRVVMDNLASVQQKLCDIYHGHAVPLDTSDKASATWGQPWLTSYLKWKIKARNRRRRS